MFISMDDISGDLKETEFRGYKNGLLTDKKHLIEKCRLAVENLSAQQREFCHAMLTAESQTAAAITAGYAEKSARSKASQLMMMPEVQEYIGLLGLLRSQAQAIDATEIISLQLRTYYEAMELGDIKAANTALDQLAKMNGLYNRLGSAPMSAKELKNKPKDEQESEIADMISILESAGNRQSA